MLETYLLILLVLIFAVALARAVRKAKVLGIENRIEMARLIRDLVMCRVLQIDKADKSGRDPASIPAEQSERTVP